MNVNAVGEFVGAALILIGSVISVISAIGIIRFPDVYTRAHAATKSSTLAVLLTLVGTFLYIWFSDAFISVRVILGILFVFITAPVSGHLIIRAAYRSNVKLADSTIEDELKPVLQEKGREDKDEEAQEVVQEQKQGQEQPQGSV
ncbi:Na+/H+ antiporter subunit G [Paenibacillus ihumii]|uniref:Na+/H+ antiporter subunit G n=1 Tax=Paenibacillus ihumii TaxID=687436 RepID=UPI0006D7B4E9|nr:Na+/H+ antiporter subunit G [Paenibacillus ihumii]